MFSNSYLPDNSCQTARANNWSGRRGRQTAPFSAEIHQKVALIRPTRSLSRKSLHQSCDWPSVVILGSQVCDQIFPAKITQSVFELHQLNKHIVLWIEAWRGLGGFEVKRQPLLDTFHAGALGQVKKQRQVQNDRSRENRVTTEKIDLDLHGITQPAENIDIVPALFVVATRRIIVNANHVRKIFVEVGIDVGLKNILEHR